MKAVSDEIFTFFTTKPSFTDVVANRLFPLVARKETTFPFAIYRIVQQEGQTKDADRFAITVSVYFDEDQYTECVTFADTVKDIVDNSRYDWQQTDVEFVEENQSYMAEISFNKN
jgi:hypothetical protein